MIMLARIHYRLSQLLPAPSGPDLGGTFNFICGTSAGPAAGPVLPCEHLT